MKFKANLQNTTLLVLCGGKGSRMNGQDKPLLEWQTKPMVDWVLSSVPKEMPKLISANRNLDDYGTRAQVVTDKPSQGAGPLVGILAGLQHATTRWVLTAPGDVPALPNNWWQHMMNGLVSQSSVVAQDRDRQQHLHLLLHRQTCTDSLIDYLQLGHHQVYKWVDHLKPNIAQFDTAFHNINTPADLITPTN